MQGLTLSVRFRTALQSRGLTTASVVSTGFNIGDTYSTAYGYDDFGRFHSVSSSVCSVCSVVNYSRLPGD